jgi:hypothetical protein
MKICHFIRFEGVESFYLNDMIRKFPVQQSNDFKQVHLYSEEIILKLEKFVLYRLC